MKEVLENPILEHEVDRLNVFYKLSDKEIIYGYNHSSLDELLDTSILIIDYIKENSLNITDKDKLLKYNALYESIFKVRNKLVICINTLI